MLAILLVPLAVLPFVAQALPASHHGDILLFRRDPDGAKGPGDQELLLSCPGAAGSSKVQRADRCTLINIVNNPDQIIFKNIGNPQLNCAGGSGPTTVTIGGSTSVSTSTTVNAEFGVSFEGISVGGGISTTDTTTQEITKEITYEVPPGRQAVYTAGFTFHSQTGNIQVNYGDRVDGHYIWYTGTTVTQLTPDNNILPRFQVHETKCGTDPNDLNNKS